MNVDRWFGPPRRRRLRLARLGVLLVALAGVVAYALLPGHEQEQPPPSLIAPGVALGVTANTIDGDTAREQDTVNRLGVGWIREEFRWPTIEPAKGQWSFTRYDELMADAAKRGLHVLPLLYQTPGWVSPHPQELPHDTAAWGRFVAQVVSRYGPDGTFWQIHPELDVRLAPTVYELWNEPWFTQFSYGGPDPARYAALVRAGVTAGRRANGSVQFLVAAEANYQTKAATVSNWLDDVLKADPALGPDIDGLAVHPYSSGGPLDASLPRVQQVLRLDDFSRTLVRHGVTPRPIWITEMGWSTCTARPDCVTDARQATYIRQLLRHAEARWRELVRGIFIYRLTDIAGSGTADPQAGYGLARIDGRHKPAWGVVAQAAVQAIG